MATTVTATWIGPGDSTSDPGSGDFATGSDWTTGVAPDAGTNVVLPTVSSSDAYVVTANVTNGHSPASRKLTIGANATLDVHQYFSVHGLFENYGTVISEGTYIEVDATFNNYGLITNRPGNDTFVDQSFNKVLTNTVDGTIRADGGLTDIVLFNGGTFANQGLVVAIDGGTVDIGSPQALGGHSAVLSGGTWQALAGSTVAYENDGQTRVVELAADVTLSGTDSRFLFNGSDIERSLATIDSGSTLSILDGRNYVANSGQKGAADFAIIDNGVVQLGGGTFEAASVSGSGQITGFGTIDATLADVDLFAVGGTASLRGSGSTFDGVLGGSGTIAFSAGSDTLASGAQLVAGAELDGATLTLDTDLSDASAFALNAGLLDLNGHALELRGPVTMKGGTIGGGGSLSTLGSTTVSRDTGIAGATTIENAGLLKVYRNLTFAGAGTLENDGSGTIDLIASGSVGIKTGKVVNDGQIVKLVGGVSTIAGRVINMGEIEAGSGTLEVTGTVGAPGGSAGTFDIERQGRLVLDGIVLGNQTIGFGGNGAALTLADASAFHGTISGFGGSTGTNDTIELSGFQTFTSVMFKANAAGTGGILTLSDGSEQANLRLTGHYTTANFTTSTDGTNGTVHYVG